MLSRSALRHGLVAAIIPILLAPGCGGGSGSPTAPATPAVPQERVIGQGTMNLRDGLDAVRHLGYFDTGVAPFTTSGAGLLKVTVDYTYVESELVPFVYSGSCTVELARLTKCPLVTTQQLARGKPYIVTIDGLPAGQYTLAISNIGLKKESVAYRISLTN